MHTVFTFDLSYWNLLVTVALPALVALATKRFAPGNVKALVLVGLSIVGGLLNQIIAQGGSFEVGKTLWYIVGTFAVAVVAHYGLLAPLAVTGAYGAVAKSVPGGLGPAGAEVPPAVVTTTTTNTTAGDAVIIDPPIQPPHDLT
jgi:hypothetical protein